MNRIYTKLFLLAVSVVTTVSSIAQLSVTGQFSGIKFLGDVGKKSNANYISNLRLGYGFGIEYRIGKVLGIGIDGVYGKLAGTDNDKSSHLNFQTSIMGGGINFFTFFDKLGETQKVVSPYFHAGIGYVIFDPYGDLKDKNGKLYNYWSDGSIRDQKDEVANLQSSTIIKRDYSYETQLKDSTVSYARNTLFIPLGIGAKFQMGFRSSLRIGMAYNLSMTDYIDNFKSGGNDSWGSASIALNIHFGKKPKDAYSNVDFSEVDNIDSDEDGVNDLLDKCLGTPKGVKINGDGCPEDKDNDGIYDYMDQELTSKKGAMVDVNGVTIDEDALAKRQLEWDSLSSERSEGFNSSPSLTYLKEIEDKTKEIKSKSGKTSKIPAEFMEADYNKDGVISAAEITKTIDGFFDGENSFNVEKINKLIDFFFEQ